MRSAGFADVDTRPPLNRPRKQPQQSYNRDKSLYKKVVKLGRVAKKNYRGKSAAKKSWPWCGEFVGELLPLRPTGTFGVDDANMGSGQGEKGR